MENEQTFLGRGWAFLPGFHENVNPTLMTSEGEDIHQSLYILLSTRKGERVMNPDYGTDLHNLVFHNMNLTARTQLIAAVKKAVLYFEPRIQLDHVIIDVSEERSGEMKIILEYTIRLTNTRGNLVYPYYYEEHI